MTENKLQVIVSSSGLEPAEGEIIINKFSDYEAMALDWETKAKSIVVTDETQVAEMKMAREGRLFLAQKRIAIEKTRKELKEQSLRKGQAIDAIAKFLTSLIEPTEKYLKEQEDFVEIKKKAEEEAKRLELEKQLEEERIAKEKAEKEEQERIRAENELLRKQNEEKDKQLQAERLEAEEKRRLLEQESRRIQLEAEEKARVEREAVELKLKAEKEERERIQKELENIIECPHCHMKLTKDGRKA